MTPLARIKALLRAYVDLNKINAEPGVKALAEFVLSKRGNG